MLLSIGVSPRATRLFRVLLAMSLLMVTFAAICAAQSQSSHALIVPPAPEVQTLGPGDQIQVRALHAEELGEKPVRVDSEGFIMLTGLGQIHAGGLTTERVAEDIRQRLLKTIKDPQVSVDIVELHSQPVSVLGAVRTPGVYQIVGQKRLLEVISMAGGFDPESGDLVKITRPSAEKDGFKVLDVRISDLMEGRRPEMNLVLHSGDVVTVPRGKMVYVIGQVHRAGGFILREQQDMSVLKAVAMAEGVLPTASLGNARILRQVEPHAQRQEIFVDVKGILAGKLPDQALLAEDVLLIPTSTAKTVANRLFEAGIQMGTGMAIWRAY